DLDRIARALREAIDSGRVDPATRRRLGRLLRAIEQVTADIAEGMGGQGAIHIARPSPAEDPTATAPATAAGDRPAGYVSVYNPRYADLVAPTATTTTGSAVAQAEPPQLPYDRQWAEARARAAKSTGTADLPEEYRQLIRSFFAAAD
ncbi:hypothetical protein LCGC14_3000130, partial [marine sediment metagenome]